MLHKLLPSTGDQMVTAWYSHFHSITDYLGTHFCCNSPSSWAKVIMFHAVQAHAVFSKEVTYGWWQRDFNPGDILGMLCRGTFKSTFSYQ